MYKKADNPSLLVSASTLAIAVNLGVNITRGIVGDDLSPLVDGNDVAMSERLSEMFANILQEELNNTPALRLPL